MARSAAEAVEFARTQGAPAVLKIASPDIAHKTEVGGVALDVIGDEAVAVTYEGILARVKAAKPEAHIEGVVVSPMRKGGVELFVGTMRDPQWGSVIVVGLGGIWVEALKDTSLRLLPVTPGDVGEMLRELRGSPLLDGFRGSPAVDRDEVARVVAVIGDAALALGPQLVSLEINPILVSGTRIEALDALAVWDDTPVTAAESAAVQVA
jgi:succinyl-CoA synthetase beta subunit